MLWRICDAGEYLPRLLSKLKSWRSVSIHRFKPSMVIPVFPEQEGMIVCGYLVRQI